MHDWSRRARRRCPPAGVAPRNSRSGAVFGPTPVAEAIDRCERMLDQVLGDRHAEGIVHGYVATLVAMQGAFERARELVASARTLLGGLGLEVEGALVAIEAWRIEILAGDLAAAESKLRLAYDALDAVGEKYILSTVAGHMARTQYALGRFDDAERMGTLVEELATEDDIDTQAMWRCARAKMLARQGSFAQAETLAREALEILAPTDGVLLKFGALLDLAEVLRLAGVWTWRGPRYEEARALAELKGSAVMSSAARGSPRRARRPLTRLVGL